MHKKNQVFYLVLRYHIKQSNTLPLLVHYLSFILLYLRDCLTFFSNHPCQRLLTRTFSFEEKKSFAFSWLYFSVGKLCKRKNCIGILKPYGVLFSLNYEFFGFFDHNVGRRSKCHILFSYMVALVLRTDPSCLF